MNPFSFLRNSFHGYKFVNLLAQNYARIKNIEYSTNFKMVRPSFNIERYDCVGFDLDNTLCEYKIDALVRMEYNVMAEYLISKGYSEHIIAAPLDATEMDFMQRGLLLDLERGNILKLDNCGEVSRASHGTRMLSTEEIRNIYGEAKKCQIILEFFNDLTIAWEPSVSCKFRALLDFFDMPASLAYARIIDDMDSRSDNNYMKCGKDIMAVLQDMYSREHFSSEQSIFFRYLKEEPDLYINKCSDMVINWIQQLNKSKIVFLVTGSNIDYANFTASHCLGKKWKDMFDVVICYARKPGFFKNKHPFFATKDSREGSQIRKPEMGKVLSQGNWGQLYHLLGKSIGKPNPSCLYFGDNLVEDVYTPAKWGCCDTAAVVEEAFFESKRWGSYTSSDSLWGSVLRTYALTQVTTLKILASYPFEETVGFHSEKDEGFKASKE
ncbi:5'-nucleotidase domain-containing protein 1-like [Rhodnius prolixus]|uniref:5'-nucleotidase domain-containing protein 1-like n=1 Tax=Rhodnius prolixus TaxID=13249 RepID=UPI003D18D849